MALKSSKYPARQVSRPGPGSALEIGKSPVSATMRTFMARPLAKSSVATAWSDIPALLMLGAGMLLYLALISYVPADLRRNAPCRLSFLFKHVS